MKNRRNVATFIGMMIATIFALALLLESPGLLSDKLKRMRIKTPGAGKPSNVLLSENSSNGKYRDIVTTYLTGPCLLCADGTVMTAENNEFTEQIRQWTGIVKLVPLARGGLAGITQDGRIRLAAAEGWDYEECLAWTDITDVTDNGWQLYGLRNDGTIIGTNGELGFDDFRFDYSSWNNIKKFYSGISMNADHVLFGLEDNGTLHLSSRTFFASDSWDGLKNVADIECTPYIYLILMKDGTLKVGGINCSPFYDEVIQWTDITQVRICGGTQQVIGLRRDGTVVTAGTRTADLSDWKNIVNLYVDECGNFCGVCNNGTVKCCPADYSNVYEYYPVNREVVESWTDIRKIGWYVDEQKQESIAVGFKRNGELVFSGESTFSGESPFSEESSFPEADSPDRPQQSFVPPDVQPAGQAVPPADQVDALQAYANLLRNGIVLNDTAGLQEVRATYYHLIDMNGDGVDEMIVFGSPEPLEWAFAIYAYHNGYASQLADSVHTCDISYWSNSSVRVEAKNGMIHAGASKASVEYAESTDYYFYYDGAYMYCYDAADGTPFSSSGTAELLIDRDNCYGTKIGSAQDRLYTMYHTNTAPASSPTITQATAINGDGTYIGNILSVQSTANGWNLEIELLTYDLYDDHYVQNLQAGDHIQIAGNEYHVLANQSDGLIPLGLQDDYMAAFLERRYDGYWVGRDVAHAELTYSVGQTTFFAPAGATIIDNSEMNETPANSPWDVPEWNRVLFEVSGGVITYLESTYHP